MENYGSESQQQSGTDTTGIQREMTEGLQAQTAVYRHGTWRWPNDGNWHYVEPNDSTWAYGHYQQTMTTSQLKTALSQQQGNDGNEQETEKNSNGNEEAGKENATTANGETEDSPVEKEARTIQRQGETGEEIPAGAVSYTHLRAHET